MYGKLSLLFVFVAFQSFAQTYKVTYRSFFEGKERTSQDPIVLFADPGSFSVVSENILAKKKVLPYEIVSVNRAENKVEQTAFLKQGRAAQFSGPINNSVAIQIQKETKKILGYTCKRATATVNSNSMEIWYTNDLKVYGSPSLLGQGLGLVLEINRNGSSSTRATEIKKVKSFAAQALIGGNEITKTDELTYRDLLWKSRFTTFSVFENEQINFVKEAKSDENILRFAKGTIILKKIKFPEFERANNIFVQLTEQSNGDAYDRTGTVFMIPEKEGKTFFDALTKGVDSVPAYENGNGSVYKGIVKSGDYEPATELMRFFTPFGIHQFNTIKLKDKTWHDKVTYRQDITEFHPIISGKECWIGVYIGNYDQGGHRVSLELTIHPERASLWGSNTVIPLFNTLNIMEMAGQGYSTLFNVDKGLEVPFNLKKDLKNAYLRYTTTGHGGWENGDEFVPKINTISLDGNKVTAFTPWLTDCGSYRLYNPASGNFSNGLSSSDLSRSNWCPGTVTNPNYIFLGDLKAGNHTVKVQIPQGKNEGSSFSYWNVSGVLIGRE